jgi:hypothetical protein
VNLAVHRLLFTAMLTQLFGGTSEAGIGWHHTSLRNVFLEIL